MARINNRTVIILLLHLVFFSAPSTGNAFDEVSFIRLISNPEQYSGRNIQLMGVYDSGKVHFESCSAVFFSDWDIENKNYINSVCIGAGGDHPDWNGKAVIVQGKFSIEKRGAWNMTTGSIVDVQRLETVDMKKYESPGRIIRGPIYKNK